MPSITFSHEANNKWCLRFCMKTPFTTDVWSPRFLTTTHHWTQPWSLTTLLLSETASAIWLTLSSVYLSFSGVIDTGTVSYLHVLDLIWYRHYCCVLDHDFETDFIFILTFKCFSFILDGSRWRLATKGLLVCSLCAVYVWSPRDRSGQNAAQFFDWYVVCLCASYVLIFNLVFTFYCWFFMFIM
jgi:hypothetical protein